MTSSVFEAHLYSFSASMEDTMWELMEGISFRRRMRSNEEDAPTFKRRPTEGTLEGPVTSVLERASQSKKAYA